MVDRPYHKANQRMGLWLVICFTGIAAQFGTMALLSRYGVYERLGIWSMAIGVLPLLIAFFVGWRVLARLNRERIGRIAAYLAERGFEVTEKPSDAERTAFAAPLEHLMATLELRYGAARIEWFAVQTAGPQKLRLFEHVFTTGSGKTTQVHQHTLLAWPAGHPDLREATLANAPWFMMTRYPWLKRRTVRDRELKDPAFADLAQRWSIFGASDTVRRFLKPAVRAKLQTSPQGESWSVGAGWICCSFNRTLDATNFDRFLRNGREILAM